MPVDEVLTPVQRYALSTADGKAIVARRTRGRVVHATFKTLLGAARAQAQARAYIPDVRIAEHGGGL